MDRVEFERLLTARLSRRRVLTGLAAGSLAAGVSFAGRPTRARGASQGTPVAHRRFTANPFTLGVASGDPLPDGVVLWTRLAPEPLVPDGSGGLDPVPIEVAWEVADDEAFTQVVQSGNAIATPDLAHSLHVDVIGLEPGREYFYRFQVGGELSPIGRTKTAPARGAALNRFRFAFATCQHFEEGYYPAYRHMAQDDLDLVIFLGDYIYEYADSGEEALAAGQVVRRHIGPETMTLADYRLRHALYKTDSDLQAAHAAFPWVATWDDHEVVNDYAGLRDAEGSPEQVFALRRAAAYQAFYEHLPLRPSSMPQGQFMRLYRRLTFGDLVEFSVLDTRQYRADHPCGAGEQTLCAAALDPNYTMLGPEQEQWVFAGLEASTARWNVLAQQVLMAQLDHRQPPSQFFWTDAWDGYMGARNRLLTHIASRGVRNPIVLTGDWHCAFVNDLKLDFYDPAAPTVATEFVVTSISSNGDTTAYQHYYGPMVPWNPHIKFFADRRGYQRAVVTPDRWQTDLQMVDTVQDPEASIATMASFVIEDGVPGAQPA